MEERRRTKILLISKVKQESTRRFRSNETKEISKPLSIGASFVVKDPTDLIEKKSS